MTSERAYTYLERRIKIVYYSKQVIQCHHCSFCYLLPEWITVKCYIFIGRVHCVSKIGMIPHTHTHTHIYIYNFKKKNQRPVNSGL